MHLLFRKAYSVLMERMLSGHQHDLIRRILAAIIHDAEQTEPTSLSTLAYTKIEKARGPAMPSHEGKSRDVPLHPESKIYCWTLQPEDSSKIHLVTVIQPYPPCTPSTRDLNIIDLADLPSKPIVAV